MAPTSKPSASASTSTKGVNPAPDFTVNMNRIQTQLEARMKAVRSFLPSRSDLHAASSNSAGGSFSALSFSSPQPSSNPQSQAAAAAARLAAAEAEFAEDRNLDPNVGIGVTPANKNSDADGQNRDTARLRGRLLGKRGKNGEGAEKRWMRKEDSSDEEAGRSGLGRTKRNVNGRGKRSRTEMENEDNVEEAKVTLPAANALDEKYVGDRGEPVNQAGSVDGAEHPTAKPMDAEPNAATVVGNSKKRRKRKKKSKNRPDEA